MSRLRADYEQTAWRKLVRFVHGEEKSQSLPSGNSDSSHENEDRISFPNEYTAENEQKSGKGTHGSFENEQENTISDDKKIVHTWKQFEADEHDLGEKEEQLYLQKKKEMDALLKKYESWPQTKGIRLFTILYRVIGFLFCISLIGFLLLCVANLPEYGNPNNPNNNEVPLRYIESGIKETGAVNFVSGMILDYRAFDTLGESHVLFIAACCVILLLRNDKVSAKSASEDENDRIYEPKNDVILQRIAFLVVPLIMIFGIYIILNGHLSPGGGFSGGAIIGAGLILYLNAFGFKKTERFFTRKTFSVVSVCSLLFYSAAKSYSFFTGANHLHSKIPLGTPGNILSSGLILPLNICVGFVVACTMYSFYALFRKGDL